MKGSYTGINVDFEPEHGVTTQDGVYFAQFLDTFATSLHQQNMILSVDVANWNPAFWNFSLISSTAIDYVMTMETYDGNWTLWQESFEYAVNTIPPSKLGIGLESTKPDGKPWTEKDLQERFQWISQYNITQLDIWDLVIGDDMMSYLSSFMS